MKNFIKALCCLILAMSLSVCGGGFSRVLLKFVAACKGIVAGFLRTTHKIKSAAVILALAVMIPLSACGGGGGGGGGTNAPSFADIPMVNLLPLLQNQFAYTTGPNGELTSNDIDSIQALASRLQNNQVYIQDESVSTLIGTSAVHVVKRRNPSGNNRQFGLDTQVKFRDMVYFGFWLSQDAYDDGICNSECGYSTAGWLNAREAGSNLPSSETAIYSLFGNGVHRQADGRTFEIGGLSGSLTTNFADGTVSGLLLNRNWHIRMVGNGSIARQNNGHDFNGEATIVVSPAGVLNRQTLPFSGGFANGNEQVFGVGNLPNVFGYSFAGRKQ